MHCGQSFFHAVNGNVVFCNLPCSQFCPFWYHNSSCSPLETPSLAAVLFPDFFFVRNPAEKKATTPATPAVATAKSGEPRPMLMEPFFGTCVRGVAWVTFDDESWIFYLYFSMNFEAWTCETRRESHLRQGVDQEKLATLWSSDLRSGMLPCRTMLDISDLRGKFGDLSTPQVKSYLVIWMVIRHVAFMTSASAFFETLPVDWQAISLPKDRVYGHWVSPCGEGFQPSTVVPKKIWHSWGLFRFLGTLSFISCKGEACNAPRPACSSCGYSSFQLWNNIRRLLNCIWESQRFKSVIL